MVRSVGHGSVLAGDSEEAERQGRRGVGLLGGRKLSCAREQQRSKHHARLIMLILT